MRRSNVQYAVAALLVGCCAWAVTLGGQPGAAQPGQGKGKAKAADKDKEQDKEGVPADDDNLPFGFPEDRDMNKQLRVARTYLEFKDVPWPTVCDLLQRILDSKTDSFYRVEYKEGDQVRSVRVSVKTEANRIIAGFPKDGLAFYQQAFGQDAAKLLADAVKNDFDVALLADLSQRYFHTKAGAQGTILLGTLYLERGHTVEAAYYFERLLNRADADEVLTPWTLYKAALALKRSGDPRYSDALKQVTARLDRAVGRDGGLSIGRRTLSLDEIRAELDQPVVPARPSIGPAEWAMRCGNPARNAVTDGGAPFLEPLFKPIPMLDSKRAAGYDPDPKLLSDADGLIEAELERVYAPSDAKQGFPLCAFFPVTTPDTLVFRSYDGLHAYATREREYFGRKVKVGERLWSQATDFSPYSLLTTGGRGVTERDSGVRATVTPWWDTYKAMNAAGILFDNPLLGTLAHDGRYVYYADDIGIPPPPVAGDLNGPIPQPQQQVNSGTLARALNAGELCAVDLATGNVVWRLGRAYPFVPHASDPKPRPRWDPPAPLSEEEGDQATDAFRLCIDAVFLGPPLPLNGRLYVLIEHSQTGVVRLVCLDPNARVRSDAARDENVKFPALLWSQKLGRPERNAPGDPIRRYQGTFLAAGEGVLVCPTNSGAVIGVDVMSRSLLWAHAYRKRREPEKPRPGQPAILERLPEGRWRAASPIVSGGRVIMTAYDAPRLECLDLRTGRVVWELPRDTADLYVGGVVNGKVIIVSQNKIRAYHLNEVDPPVQKGDAPTPRLAWAGSEALATPTGHGVVGKGVFFVPVQPNRRMAGRDESAPAAEIWGVSVDTGQVVSKTVARVRGADTEEPDRLVRFGLGNLVYQDGMVFAQSADQVLAFPQLEAKKTEMDLALKANPKDPRGLAQRGTLLLDDGKLQEAIADFKKAEENEPPEEVRTKIRAQLYVAYTQLLRSDFPAGEKYLQEYDGLCDAPDNPEVRNRRRRLYHVLLARGREKQGRLVEAFDQYLELAALGGELNPDPDDPSVEVRDDVWARGRIESMVRRTSDPTTRKALDERVNREWEAVKGGNDLNRLRRFVAVFGPYFRVGAEAELALAETLVRTHDEKDAREAQTLLAHLRATGEDPVIRARATEALARVMIGANQLEDAVALYLQLGKDYPDVIVRDGKTGADFLTDLLTDKRLLPYLEPSRYPLPAQVKVEQVPMTGQSGPAFEIEPEGELLPAYRRLRFVVDLMQTRTNTGWTIRGIDRATGRERCTFSGLTQPLIQEFGSVPYSRFFKGSGHLVIFQLGVMVYCFDLAQNRRVWEVNLLRDGPRDANVNPNQQLYPNPDGEVTVVLPHGQVITLGKSAVLQPGYCALLTRHGLEVFDPTDKDRRLWTREHLPDRVHVYGDSQCVLLIAGEGVGGPSRPFVPVSTRLLRAVDGTALDRAPDAGRVLAAAKSYKPFGRTVLLNEGGGATARVVRLLDLTTGKDVWRKDYEPGSIYLNAINPQWTGAVRPDGTAEILDVQSGRSVATLKVGRGHQGADLMAGAAEAQLFADRDRFYVVLDREYPPAPAGRLNRVPLYNFSLRTQRVNGPMVAFERASGQRQWVVEELFDNQMLILDQFEDLPVITAATLVPDPNLNGRNSYKVVIVQKDEGRVVYNRSLIGNGNVFQGLEVKPQAQTIEYRRNDLAIRVSPDDGATPQP
jgi:tetratricopeptide (TPR) repeat protein